ncbi:MAG TPA: hypothetical protein VID50_12505 [Candidatus Eisenbacteria bacterium]|jgi:hypothetical protein
MLAQWIAAGALVLAAGAYLIRRAARKRREGLACDRCAAVAHLRTANRPDVSPSSATIRKK